MLLSLKVTVRAMRELARACIRNIGRQYEKELTIVITVNCLFLKLSCQVNLMIYLEYQTYVCLITRVILK